MESLPTLSAADAWALLVHTHLDYYICACVHVLCVHVPCVGVHVCHVYMCECACRGHVFSLSIMLILGTELCLDSRHLYLISHLASPFTLHFKTRSLTEPGWNLRVS